MQLVEPGDRGLAEVGVGHVGQGRAAPQGERLAEGLPGGARVLAQLGAASMISSARSLAPATSTISPGSPSVRTSSGPSSAACTGSIVPD